jgi:hypothetical protein
MQALRQRLTESATRVLKRDVCMHACRRCERPRPVGLDGAGWMDGWDWLMVAMVTPAGSQCTGGSRRYGMFAAMTCAHQNRCAVTSWHHVQSQQDIEYQPTETELILTHVNPENRLDWVLQVSAAPIGRIADTIYIVQLSSRLVYPDF